jgi:hypothetical protein
MDGTLSRWMAVALAEYLNAGPAAEAEKSAGPKYWSIGWSNYR